MLKPASRRVFSVQHCIVYHVGPKKNHRTTPSAASVLRAVRFEPRAKRNANIKRSNAAFYLLGCSCRGCQTCGAARGHAFRESSRKNATSRCGERRGHT